MGRSRAAQRRDSHNSEELDIFVLTAPTVEPRERGALWTLPASLAVVWAAFGLGLFVGQHLEVMLGYGLVLSAGVLLAHAVDY
jgi:hypothetical protein